MNGKSYIRALCRSGGAVVAGLTMAGLLATSACGDDASQPAEIPAVEINRSVNLAGVDNARDAGGYQTTAGQTVRTGVLFRTAVLGALSPEATTTLRQLGVRQVFDLRSVGEVQREPDVLPEGVERIAVPIELPLFQVLGAALSGGPQHAQEQLGNGKAEQLMVDFYRAFVTDSTSRGQFATVLKAVADGSSPQLMHCTGGKDRTGTLSAMLLTLLGVPSDTVYADYLESNARLANANNAMIDGLRAQLTNAELLQPILDVKKEYLAEVFAQIDTDYGSFDTFVARGLGLDAATVAKLRQRLLT